MTDVIVRAAAWAVRLFYPASGRHRACLPVLRLATSGTAAPGVPKPRKAKQETEPLFGEVAAMVRPYFLAYEEVAQRKSRALLVCARLGAVEAQGVRW